MVINNSSSFRRYTPPTCTLEIYNPQPFWGKWRYQSFPQYFSFQLHFDDPRIPKDNRSSIIGDRTLLEKLRQLVDEYINLYLDDRQIVRENKTCDIPQDENTEFICLSRESDYSHKLYYHGVEPQRETVEVILTNTQLFDLINALEAYYYDVTKSNQELGEAISSNLGLSIFITALVCIIGGWFWWRYEQNLALQQNPTDNQSQPSDTEEIADNIQKVIPPSPLDPKSLPSIISPEVPEELKNRESLPPPESTITQPPENNPTTENLEEFPENVNQATLTMETPPPPSVNSLPPSTINNTSQITTIQPSLSQTISLQPSSPNLNTIPSSPPRLNKLPVLSSPNSSAPNLNSFTSEDVSPSQLALNNINRTSDITPPIVIKNPTLPENINNLDTSKLVAKKLPSTTAETEVKQYFVSQWQPPENLQQSIEYRLQINSEGQLTKVTPIGQVAIIYLDRTNMPLLGEKIVSTVKEENDSQSIIRLILSPNGSVQTFKE
ncbi:DUF4335 domain-containing protein [Cyanobacterium sp. DS4]|uniref:DUF4335 domain-containing protein n=1 Tax=Cyanobacterium sp. DS4 TaxID=2878255 RepID=UPI002E8245DF|nr:DUF4335 domain-containing protein [Cyanobacterium sp. Dongsha4]WVL02081.1 DUF4335 domain-containing protein [Cyanobacterium sp. Dongsha4]